MALTSRADRSRGGVRKRGGAAIGHEAKPMNKTRRTYCQQYTYISLGSDHK